MLFKRKIQISLVKDDDKLVTPETPEMSKERINTKEAILEVGTFVVVGTLVVMTASFVLNVAGELVLHALDPQKDND